MGVRDVRLHLMFSKALLILVAMSAPAFGWEQFEFTVSGDDASLKKSLEAATVLGKQPEEERAQPRAVLAAALAEYSSLLNVLYAQGHYGGVIKVKLDGREAAGLSVVQPPSQIAAVSVQVTPGPQYIFGHAKVGPLAPGTKLPEGFQPGQPAHSDLVQKALEAAVNGWRDAGHARPNLSHKSLTANHRTRTLSAVLTLNPGPKVRFGHLNVVTPSKVREARIRKIAGFPQGAVFSPKVLGTVAKRLRRTGAFGSVSLKEGEIVTSANTMDVSLALADEAPRRIGFGAEVSSLDGLTLSGFWIHRNLFGGAERLKLEADVTNIDKNSSGTDYSLGGRLEIPAAFGADTKAFFFAEAEKIADPGYQSKQGALGFGAGRIFSEALEGEIGVAWRRSHTTDDLGTRDFNLLALPVSITWDKRDNPLDATRGFYLGAKAEPFLGLGDGGSGFWVRADARVYHSVGGSDRVVLAGRAQLGFVHGPTAARTHPDYLFFSGGGDTVRGQSYQSLAVDLGGGNTIGGQAFASLSGELRVRATDTIGAVAFVDVGQIGAKSLFDSNGGWHAGGGIGLRYLTGIGPIRLDAAVPLHGGSGNDFQLYLGIGQVF